MKYMAAAAARVRGAWCCACKRVAALNGPRLIIEHVMATECARCAGVVRLKFLACSAGRSRATHGVKARPFSEEREGEGGGG